MLKRICVWLVLSGLVFGSGMNGWAQESPPPDFPAFIDLMDGGNHDMSPFQTGSPRGNSPDPEKAGFWVSLDVFNGGTIKSGAFAVKIWAYGPHGPFMVGRDGLSSVQPGGSAPLLVWCAILDDMQDLFPIDNTYQLYAQIDAYNDVQESNEENNLVNLGHTMTVINPGWDPVNQCPYPIQEAPAVMIVEEADFTFYGDSYIGPDPGQSVIADLDTIIKIDYKVSNRGNVPTGNIKVHFYAFHSAHENVASTAVQYLGYQSIDGIAAHSSEEQQFPVRLNELPEYRPGIGLQPNPPMLPGHKYYLGWDIQKINRTTWPYEPDHLSMGWECNVENGGVRITRHLFVRQDAGGDSQESERIVVEEGETYNDPYFYGGIPIGARQRVKNESRFFSPRIVKVSDNDTFLVGFDARNISSILSYPVPAAIYIEDPAYLFSPASTKVGSVMIEPLPGGYYRSLLVPCSVSTGTIPVQGEYKVGIVIDNDFDGVPYQEEYHLFIED